MNNDLITRTNNLFLMIFVALFLWFLPVTVTSVVYSFIHEVTIRVASKELLGGNVVIAWSLWLIAALVVSYFVVYASKDDPDFDEPKPMFNDNDEVMNQTIINIARRKPDFADVVAMADMNMRIKQLTEELAASKKWSARLVHQLAQYDTETMENGEVATVVQRYKNLQAEQNLYS